MANFINPQSTVYLCNVDIKNDYKHQFTFASINEQTNFFLSKRTGTQFTNCTFIRDGEISAEGKISDMYRSNYLMFQNTGFDNKWFYAFITEFEYINENCTKIHYELDCFQTWYFDIVYKQSFVLRKHVVNDAIRCTYC